MEGDLDEVVDEDEDDVSPARGTVETSAWHDSDDDEIEVDLAAGANRLRKLAKESDVVEEEVEVEAGDEGHIGGRETVRVLNTVLGGREYQKRLRERASASGTRLGWVEQLRDRQRGEKEGGEGTATQLDRTKQQLGGLLEPKSKFSRIPPTHLEVTKLADANKTNPSQSVLTSIQFHPSSQLFMTSSLDRRVRFFAVDGVENPHIQSIFFEDMPVTQASFVKAGAGVLCAGRRKFFYSLDLETSRMEKVAGVFGREERSFERFIARHGGDGTDDVVAFVGNDGSLPLVSVTSRQSVGTLKMNGTVRAGAWSGDGRYLVAGGGDGVVCVWDMRHQRRCVRAFRDEGSLGVTSVGVGKGGLLAVGSSSGIVNMYRDVWKGAEGSEGVAGGIEGRVEPVKVLSQLTTAVDTVEFSRDGQLFVMGSRMKRDAMRLVHVDSMTAYSNWPTSKSPLHYVHSACFSPSAGFLCVGNARGRAVTYRLHHFDV